MKPVSWVGRRAPIDSHQSHCSCEEPTNRAFGTKFSASKAHSPGATPAPRTYSCYIHHPTILYSSTITCRRRLLGGRVARSEGGRGKTRGRGKGCQAEVPLCSTKTCLFSAGQKDVCMREHPNESHQTETLVDAAGVSGDNPDIRVSRDIPPGCPGGIENRTHSPRFEGSGRGVWAAHSWSGQETCGR